MMRALPAIAGAFIATCITAGANDALNFWNTNPTTALNKRATAAPPLDIRPANQRRAEEQRLIRAANARAAAKHNVPVEFMDRLTMRESGFRFVQGPPTRWGRAQGPHQILCSTAAELGERDCSRLMRDAERSADLSARYVRMGYEATGSWSGAAAHCHGGPNRRLWGPKTQAYASAVGGRSFAVATDLTRQPRGTFGNAPILVAAFQTTEYR
jgi:hypothetical protein